MVLKYFNFGRFILVKCQFFSRKIPVIYIFCLAYVVKYVIRKKGCYINGTQFIWRAKGYPD